MSPLRAPIISPVRDASIGFGLLPRCLCRWVRGPLWQLEEDYTFTLAARLCMEGCKPASFIIPAGYQFDKASVPPLFWGPPFNYLPDGLCTVAALEHDFLCDLLGGGSDWLRKALVALPECPPPAMVHEHFRLRLRASGVRRSKAEAMGRTVAAFGPRGWAWAIMRFWLIVLGCAAAAWWLTGCGTTRAQRLQIYGTAVTAAGHPAVGVPLALLGKAKEARNVTPK